MSGQVAAPRMICARLSSSARSSSALAAQGDQAEALNAFRRCRELLSIVLGVKPSAETERLHHEIAAGERPSRLS